MEQKLGMSLSSFLNQLDSKYDQESRNTLDFVLSPNRNADIRLLHGLIGAQHPRIRARIGATIGKLV
jgi:hypothetical protein